MKFCPNPLCPFLLETGIVAEFKDSATVCVDCQSRLIDELSAFERPLLEIAEDEESYDEEQYLLVTLANYLHQTQARLLRQRMQSGNIPTYLTRQVIEADAFAGAVGRLQLLVRAVDFELALEILETQGDEEVEGSNTTSPSGPLS